MTTDDQLDEERLAGYADDLAAAIDAALGPWVVRSVRSVADDQEIAIDDAVDRRTFDAAEQCRQEIGARIGAVLDCDIDQQRVNPLHVLRDAVRYPAEVLAELGARPVSRDRFALESFPDDVYDLTPSAFADIDPALHEPGLAWGAAKAHVHIQRRRQEGRR